MKQSEINALNILNNISADSTADTLEKSMGHKYFKREGVPGHYKYYYTEADYKAGKSSPSEPSSTSTISVQELDKMIREFGKSGKMPSDDVLEDLASRSCYKNRPKNLREAIETSIEAHSKSSDSNEQLKSLVGKKAKNRKGEEGIIMSAFLAKEVKQSLNPRDKYKDDDIITVFKYDKTGRIAFMDYGGKGITLVEDKKGKSEYVPTSKEKAQAAIDKRLGELYAKNPKAVEKNTEDSRNNVSPQVKRVMDSLTTVNSKYSDPQKVTVSSTPKGNWRVYYDGKETGVTLGGNQISEDTIRDNQWEHHD